MRRGMFILLLLVAWLVAACDSDDGDDQTVNNAEETATAIITQAETEAAAMLEMDTPVPPTDEPTAEPTDEPTAEPTEEPDTTTSESDQLAAGAEVYAAHCAGCHGAEFEGGAGPRLTRPVLRFYNTAEKLYDYTSRAMPQSAPGSLDDQQYYDVVAHLLFGNGFIDETVTVGPDTAADIELQ